MENAILLKKIKTLQFKGAFFNSTNHCITMNINTIRAL